MIPSYQLEEFMVRLGLALGAGVIIFIVPLAYRKTRYEASRMRRVVFTLVYLAAFAAFCAYVWLLWDRFIPRKPAPPPPAPVVYPANP